MMRRRCTQYTTEGDAAELQSLTNAVRQGQLRAQRDSVQRNWFLLMRNWLVFYALVFVFGLVFFENAIDVVSLMQAIAFIALLWNFPSLREVTAFIEEHNDVRKITLISKLSTCLLAVLLCSSYDPLGANQVYTYIYFALKPCAKLERMMTELRFESSIPQDLPYLDAYRPLQAMGLDNAHLKKFSNALVDHFERLGRNETEQFQYVEHLNLIGNLFDDEGAAYLMDALQHPHAYTSTLLLGRSHLIGDPTAFRLANLIQHHPSLTWLSFEGTAVTEAGLDKIYEALGTRPFEYLGLDYTDKVFYMRWPWQWFMPPPVANSLPSLYQATYLQQLGLTGNALGDNDMGALSDSVPKTNITELTLVHNSIGPKGVEELLPLTRNKLTNLQLGINWRIGGRGAVLLANALLDPNSTVTNLGLFQCRVGQEGAEAFLSIFPGNEKLKMLSLGVHGKGKDMFDGNIKEETLRELNRRCNNCVLY